MGLEPGQRGPSYTSTFAVFYNGTLAQVSGVCEGSCSERSDLTQSFPILPQINNTDLRVPRGLPVWESAVLLQSERAWDSEDDGLTPAPVVSLELHCEPANST